MLEFVLAPFWEFAFMRQALLACVLLSIGAAPVGVFLMLRRMSLIGDAMSHAILPGVAIGFFISGLSIGAMTVGGLLAGCCVAAMAGLVSRFTIGSEDASMAAFYLISLSFGVLLISIKGSNVDLLHVLFGSALALNSQTLVLLGITTGLTLLTLAVIYRPLVYECFDPQFLALFTRGGSIAHQGFLLLVVVNLVAGFHALGTLMSVGLMVLPAAAARYWVARLESMLVIAILVAVCGATVGLVVSYHIDWPSGPLIVFVLGLFYIGSVFFGVQGGLVTRLLKFKHLEA